MAKHTFRVPSVHRSTDRVITGTAGGWAERYGVDPTVVRVALALLTFVAGLGALLYGVMFLLAEPPEKDSTPIEPPVDHRRDLAVATATAAVLTVARHVGVWPGDRIMLPAAAVAFGVAIVWSRAGQADRRGAPVVPQAIRLGAGIVLLIAGVAALANLTGGLGSVGASLSAIAVVIGGLALFGAPALGRILRDLDEERSTRIREDERAKVSAHLHDSVLQSLVLIQRSDNPRHMANLARRQERELRAWLYGDVPIGDPTTLHAAIEVLTTQLEADHDTRIEAVIVGDQPLDEASRALVAALREAIVNAARHADVDRIDVFVEADDTELTGFVRDTGTGFDPTSVSPDRHGINDSIIGRVERVGGTAVIESNPGAGTEVEIRIPEAGDVTTIRVVLVEDHALFRAGVRRELADMNRDDATTITVVGEAADRDEAIAIIRASKPDVVLLDVHLPGGGGDTVIRALRDDHIESRFLALSVSDAAEDVIAVVRAGARGYVTKSITIEELREAIERVHSGDAVFSPRLAGFVLDAFAGDLPMPADPELDQLTEREQEVMRLIARGYTYRDVGTRLHLSVKTIESHVSSVLRKLQLTNRHQLTAWANERRIV